VTTLGHLIGKLVVAYAIQILPRITRHLKVGHACRAPQLACTADEDEAISGTGASLQTVPERCAYLELMRAYASDAWSAQQTSLQLRDNRGYDGYKQLTWHALFRRLALVHVLFKNFPDDSSTELPIATQVRSSRACCYMITLLLLACLLMCSNRSKSQERMLSALYVTHAAIASKDADKAFSKGI
jgi:hypothetical protein